MLSPLLAVNRRRVLVGGAALAVLGVAAACGSRPSPPAVDELQAQLTLAEHDSALAAAAVTAARPPIAAALTQVAAERGAHAKALATEIARLAPKPVASASGTASPALSSTPPVPAPSLSEVVDSLRASAESASRLATTSSGYRAGLLGSISAACTTAYTVALVFGEPTP